MTTVHGDPRSYNDYQSRYQAALQRRDIKRLYCRKCQCETYHSHGTRFAYCLRCFRNHDDETA